MEQRRLGPDGPQLSIIGLGCNNFGMRMDEPSTHAVVHAALDAGITHFDTAEMYGGGQSEEFLGTALGARRDEVVIATKFSPRPADQPYTPGILALRIREAADLSLKRLGTDRIDVYYQHYPDPDAPIEEALTTLQELVDAGKVLHIAEPNVTAEQIAEAESVAVDRELLRFTGTQIHWSLLNRGVEESVVPAAVSAGLGVVPYFPLASGLLTGKYRRGESPPEGTRLAVWGSRFADRWATDENYVKVEALEAFAADHGHSITELALGWLLAQPCVASVIAGATRPEQIESNVSRWELSSSLAEQAAAL